MIQPNYTYKAVIVKIIDGDTIDADIDVGFKVRTIQRLRLLGVDCPEMNGPDKETGLLAKAFAIGAVLGKPVVLMTTKADAFGRYLADVMYMDGDKPKNLNDELIANGFAVVYPSKG